MTAQCGTPDNIVVILEFMSICAPLGRFLCFFGVFLYDIIGRMTGSGIFFFAVMAAAPAVPVPASASEATFESVPVVAPTYAGVAISDDTHPELPPESDQVGTANPTSSMPLVSINTDSVLDMNWSGAMELVDPILRPLPITLPFFDNYPIDNIEVKLRMLKLPF